MKGFINKIQTGILTLAVAGMAAPLTTYAGNHGGFSGGRTASRISSFVSGQITTNNTTSNSNTPSNTGLAHTQVDLLQSFKDKHHDKSTAVNPSGVVTLSGPKNTLVGPVQKLIDIKTAADSKKAASKAAKAAQAAADKSAADLKVATDKFTQAETQQIAARDAYLKSGSAQDMAALDQAHRVAVDASEAKVHAAANAATANAALGTAKAAQSKASADLKGAVLHTVLPGDNLPTNQFPSGQVITSSSSPVGSTRSTTTTDSTSTAPKVQAAVTTAAPTTDTATAVATGADLVLEDIQLASPATLVAGPAYTVKFRNQGTDSATKFQVGLLAEVDGELTADAPRGVIEVKSLAAGASGEVTLRLPQSALKMIGTDGRPMAFTLLLVAVDLKNTVAESDETNNTADVERATLETTVAN